MKQHEENDGLLKDKGVESIEIYDIDIDKKVAKAKVIIEEEEKNYNIKYEIDENYKLSAISIDEI